MLHAGTAITQANTKTQPVQNTAVGSLMKRDWYNNKFNGIRESTISRAMTCRDFDYLDKFAESDVVIISAGICGLSTAWFLVSTHPDLAIAVIEATVAPGRSAYLEGQLFIATGMRKPADQFLTALSVTFENERGYIIVKHAAIFTATLLSKYIEFPRIKLCNATAVENLITRIEGRHKIKVAGVVFHWTLMAFNYNKRSCMASNTINSQVVISIAGHDGPFGTVSVNRLMELRTFGRAARSFEEEKNEALIVDCTCEAAPEIIIGGMELEE